MTKTLTKAGTRTAAIYARISQALDPTDTLGVDRQVRGCLEHAEREGIEVAPEHVYIDNDVSAYGGKPRPRYLAMLKALSDVDVVITYAADRLTRHPRELEDLIDALESTGTDVHTLSGSNVDLTTVDGRLVARMLGAAARSESERSSKRIRDKNRERAEAGLPHGGNRSYGYERDGMTINEAEAAIVREATQRVIAGDSLRAITHDLQRRGVPTAKGGKWSPVVVRAMVLRARNAGYRERNGVLHRGVWPAIVDEEQWKRAVAILSDPARATAIGARGKAPKLLTGIATCSLCGGTLRAQPRRGKDAYTCRKSGDVEGCGKISIAAEPLEMYVMRMLVLRSDNLGTQTPDTHDDEDRSDMDALDRIVCKRDELAEEWARDEISRVEYRRSSDALAKVEAEINKRLRDRMRHTAPIALVSNIGTLTEDSWHELTTDTKRMMLQAVVDSIIVSPAARQGRVFDSSRIKIMWKS